VSDWVDVAGVGDLPDGGVVAVRAHDYSVALFRIGEGYHALWSRCPHAGGPLEDGMFRGDTVSCPWHSSTFRVTDGTRVSGPSAVDATAFPVEVADGRVLVGPPPPGTPPPPPTLFF
jgi:nitrite reductase/ring-hydroxylating ferredoxin subunit